ncbi:transcription factor bHLH76-like [Hibiscus syriacus]|uniref:Transcription factor bHLH76-like n=1 Tax=Hibiscus syriacus TaxID=106335 RepID=A0A6A3B3S0_HIBSY|nr:uncharacterized protein LOC120115959 [Hibiscus syriacus]KAE8711684.1 transcription factor bHLH76-like [Hibiscus syriacus]
MSGVSLAMALRSDPDHTVAAGEKPERKPQLQPQSEVGGSIMGSLRVIELQLVVFIMVFSISGLVPLIDLVFPAFASAYIIGLSRFAFPSCGYVPTASQEIFHGSKLFRLYVVIGTTIGLFLPLAYVLGGFARGEDHDVRAATPHLFLLSFQILTENVIGGLSLFSPPVRALVPLLYTVRRIFVLIDWIHDVWLIKALPTDARLKDIVWHWFGKGLAVANLLYFSINLFLFLIPRFLPQAFERYFKERVEIHGKTAEDNRPTAANKPQSTNKKVD